MLNCSTSWGLGGSWYVTYLAFRERLPDFSVSGRFTAYFVRRPIVGIACVNNVGK